MMSTREKKKIIFTVHGEPASKANSRQLVTIKNRPAFIKSKKALGYLKDFSLQCPQIDPPLESDVRVTMTIFYATRRPDLDEAVILDCMQSQVRRNKQTKEVSVVRNNIYKNDRQVKEKHIHWGLDKEDPRAEIEVEEI